PSSTLGAAGTADWQLAIYASYTPNVRPTVTWSKPLDGQKVSGQLNEANGNCEAVATENQGTIDRVDFYLDGTLLNTERYVPYSCIWDTTTAADGSAHTLRAVAYDTSGNSADASIKVTVANGSTPPPISIHCDQTIASGESFASFLGRVGSGQDGCLTAGTYEVGVATGWRSG